MRRNETERRGRPMSGRPTSVSMSDSGTPSGTAEADGLAERHCIRTDFAPASFESVPSKQSIDGPASTDQALSTLMARSDSDGGKHEQRFAGDNEPSILTYPQRADALWFDRGAYLVCNSGLSPENP